MTAPRARRGLCSLSESRPSAAPAGARSCGPTGRPPRVVSAPPPPRGRTLRPGAADRAHGAPRTGGAVSASITSLSSSGACSSAPSPPPAHAPMRGEARARAVPAGRRDGREALASASRGAPRDRPGHGLRGGVGRLARAGTGNPSAMSHGPCPQGIACAIGTDAPCTPRGRDGRHRTHNTTRVPKPRAQSAVARRTRRGAGKAAGTHGESSPRRGRPHPRRRRAGDWYERNLRAECRQTPSRRGPHGTSRRTRSGPDARCTTRGRDGSPSGRLSTARVADSRAQSAVGGAHTARRLQRGRQACRVAPERHRPQPQSRRARRRPPETGCEQHHARTHEHR